ncbi:helix-turn-helix transcriptional regulator [Enterovibrio nigricans]|uniref:DNA-binding transcriptional regulator, CsgD family n=1 Tax=Enterovibrio nigricans DSM 22720 TaxID=1121868 RepID=A0A1T4V6K5_9GAMM|nr:helix-turn-helix transcriptional regulator [Enterovibrio nigricans]PKF48945.1 LuxR family transcriptional regulator [Enterovibrio nigricans]SKA60583.1 DNA-binding transcriptional regulator, CsgD family [Enterovibrio nigricans DSM 22720]
MKADIHQLIASIYGSAASGNWMPALEKLEKELGANRCILGSFNPQSLTPNSLHITDLPPVLASFQDAFVHDPIYKHAAEIPPTEVMVLNSVQNQAPFKGSWFFNEYHIPADIGHIMGSNFLLTDDEYAFVAVNRSSKMQGFDEEEFRLLSGLISHFVNAFEIYDQNRQHLQNKAIFDAICESYNCGVGVIDENGCILFSNGLADDIFCDYNVLSVNDGVISSSSIPIRSKLAQACRDIVHAGVCASQVIIPIVASQNEPAMQIRLSPLVLDDDFPSRLNVRVLMTIKVAEDNAMEYVSQTYGFTKSETRVAELLVQGNTLQEISDTLFRSRETIKTHLKNLMMKTKTHTQTKLISMLLQQSV